MVVSTPVARGRTASRRRQDWQWVLWPLGVYVGTRLTAAVLLLLVGREQGPRFAVGSFDYFGLIQNWDGGWFGDIAEHGYPSTLPRENGEVQQSEWGYFPLFPASTRLVMELTRLPFGPAAALLNFVAAAVAMCLLYRLILLKADRFTALMSVLALCVFPSAVIWQATYSEAVTLVLVVAAVWCLHRRNYGLLLLVALPLAVARPLAVPLALALVVHGVMRWRARSREEFPVRERWALAATVPLVGLMAGLWPLVAAVVTGEPDAYLETLDAWKFPGERAVGWQSFVSQAVDYPAVAVIGACWLGLQAWLLLGPRRESWVTDLRIWSLCYATYLLFVTMPQAGTLRHLLLILVPFWPLTELNERTTSPRVRWVVFAAVCVLGLAAQFLWLRWFWVPSPHWRSVP